MISLQLKHVLFLVILIIANLLKHEGTKIKCIDRERQALLKFKEDLGDIEGVLSSWETDPDCCKWSDIRCDNETNHVTALDFSQVLKAPEIFRDYIYQARFDGAKIKCIDRERRALLKFKEDLVDIHGVLSSWRTDPDCCKWRGIRCDNETNHVTALDFQVLKANPIFQGKISPSLLELQHLNYLDLSSIDINETTIPEFIGHLRRLKYLNLSSSSFKGAIPPQLGNLSELQHLDLSYSFYAYSTNLDWLHTLHSLEYLDLSFVNLTQVINWLPALAKPPLLRELRLRLCDLPEIHSSSTPILNFSSLSILDLSANFLHPHSIYPWIFNLSSSISYIDLSYNSLQGSIPDAFKNMASLSYLSMSYNEIEGGIPRFFGNLSLETLSLYGELHEVMRNLSQHTWRKLKHRDISQNKLNRSLPDSITKFSSLIELNLARNKINGILQEDIENLFNLNVLNLSHNQLTGTLPESIGRLSKLEKLNHLEGIISEVHLLNLPMLRELDLSFNSFQFKINPSFIPPFQLDVIQLANCKQGPQFPEWLRTQHNFSSIDMSISDTIPAWFWDLSSRLSFLNFSNNQIYGKLPDLTSKFSITLAVDLSSNNFEGTLPHFPSEIRILNLFKNRFSGSLESLCNCGSLEYLDVSDNFLTGQFPVCFQLIGSSVQTLNLANNNLAGSVFAVGPECGLWSLNLRNNSFVGEFPQSFRNCKGLHVIDLGENKLSGSIPAWIGDTWPELIALSLRSNELYGEIPSRICQLSHVQVLDLSFNKITGTVPKCFNNLTAMGHEGTFEVAAYTGNSGLCGKPVTEICPGDEVTMNPMKTGDHNNNEADSLISTGFYICLGLGFVFGFWGTCGSLLFNKSWRRAFFRA